VARMTFLLLSLIAGSVAFLLRFLEALRMESRYARLGASEEVPFRALAERRLGERTPRGELVLIDSRTSNAKDRKGSTTRTAS